MACRVPGADSLDEFWRNLQSGAESISVISEAELREAGVPSNVSQAPGYVPAKGVVRDADCFDAAFFRFSPREAALMDPQQRVFLECAWSALEDAGCDARQYAGAIGVFAGSILSSYLLMNVWPHRKIVQEAGVFQTALGNDPTFLASRVAYQLDLGGASVSVGTACSTSLVAVHLACQSLLTRDVDMALAGGISLHLPLRTGYTYQEGGILSPDGHCRPFDALAQGTVSSDGAGIVVLKRLDDALADGDSIRAVIRGSAINNDGAAKVGYTAPSVSGQARVIAEALGMAGVDPAAVSMVETHGAATSLGDPIEFAALCEAFGEANGRTGYCALSSVKSNLGHLDAAAGIAGFIKTVLALQHRQIPGTLHFQKPNPQINLASSPFYVNSELRPMAGDGPFIAGVSSFGIGGTNVHVVLEEAPQQEEKTLPPAPCELLTISARTPAALEAATARLASHLEAHPELTLADVAHTLRIGRRPFEHRRSLVCGSLREAIDALRSGDARQLPSAVAGTRRSVAFMFPGLGDHYPAMGWHLYCTQPVFRESIDCSATLLTGKLPSDIRDFLYRGLNWHSPKLAAVVSESSQGGPTLDLRAMLARAGRSSNSPAPADLPTLAQPGIFVTEVALAALLQSWGIEPAAFIGHSIGELAAAHLSGIFSLENALEFVALRARLIETRVRAGAMMAVSMREPELRSCLPEGVSLAAVNGADVCIASGEEEGIRALEILLKERGLQPQRLRSTHAYHSTMMEALVPELAAAAGAMQLSAPQVPILSCVSGQCLTDEEATDPQYWARHICRTVRFCAGVNVLLENANMDLLEVGPGQGLTAHAIRERDRQQRSACRVLPTMRWAYDQQSELAVLLRAAGQLWMAGLPLNFAGLSAREGLRRVPLPAYPFERQKFWIEPADANTAINEKAGEKEADLADWFYLPCWKPAGLPRSRAQPKVAERWLIFADEYGVGSDLARQLRADGGAVWTVERGSVFRASGNSFALNPVEPEDYAALIAELMERQALPTRIIHLWSLTQRDECDPSQARFEAVQELGYHSVTRLLQALFRAGSPQAVRLDIVANGLFQVHLGDAIVPEKATVRAPALVAPQERPGTVCRLLDSDLAPEDPAARAALTAQISRELHSDLGTPVVVYRSGQRWVQAYERVRFEADELAAPIRHQGCYLITGGLGGVGLVLAHHLASKYQARLALIGRTALPLPAAWPDWLAEHGEEDPVSRKIRQLQALEALGAEVIALPVDVSDRESMRRALHTIEDRFGALHGVIHAAGNVGIETFRELTQLTRADADAQFSAKVRGLLVLDEVLAGRALDFCLLTSSLSAVLGGLGFTAYSAANLFMDAFALAKSPRGVRWTSVDWESWRLADVQPAVATLGATVSGFGMQPEEGCAALERILAQESRGQVIVASGDLHQRLRQWVEPSGGAVCSPAPLVPHTRPVLQVEFVEPRGELEGDLAEIWRNLFAVNRVGIHDNFFELGGHSLLATQLNARIYGKFGVELSLATLLRNPTIAQQAVTIVSAQAEKLDPELLEALLAESAEACAATE